MIKAVFFDLDGTLLPMDMDKFIAYYFELLAKKLENHGYERDKLLKAVWTGTAAMIKNNGEKTNEQVFWDYFSNVFGDKVFSDTELFNEFYRDDFQKAKAVCGYTPLADKTVKTVLSKNLAAVLATNPMFPKAATQSRISWAGLDINDFTLYSTYEDYHYSKPNPKYFKEVAEKAGFAPEECLMVGNDAEDDLAAAEIGMKVFILTDCLINKNNVDLSSVPHGDFNKLISFIENL